MVPRRGKVVAFRRPFMDQRVRLGAFLGLVGGDKVLLEVGIRGTTTTSKIIVPKSRVFFSL